MPSTTDSAKSGPTNKTSTRSNGLAEVPAGATVVPNADNNYDEAPPGVTGPDQSARDTLRKQAKPVFNRGPSMLDFTAITSAGPTPAGELPPSASYFDGSRLRESHLPDEEDLERMRRQTVAEIDSELPRRRVPGDEVQGADAFAPRTSRQETADTTLISKTLDETGGWTAASHTHGDHTHA